MNPTETYTAFQLRNDIPDFKPGDTIAVHIKISEGNKERIQVFQGIVIKKRGKSNEKSNKIPEFNSSFTVRKISNGVGVEKIFPMYSPVIDRIEIVKRGAVRRAKLFYLRERTGKSARVAEKKMIETVPPAGAADSEGPKKKTTKKGKVSGRQKADSTRSTEEKTVPAAAETTEG